MPFFPSLPDDATTKQMNRLVEGHGIKADHASFNERGRKHVEMGYIAQYEAAAKDIR